MSLSVVILAAGKGTRMFSDYPKVLHNLANQPLLQYVIDIAKSLNPENINIVVGYKSKEVKSVFSHEKLNWIIQKEQLGTGDAVKYAIPHLKGSQTIILYGDVPMVELDDLKQLIKKTENNLGVLTFNKTNPTGYGRIKRIENNIEEIVEEKDCDDLDRKITEINTGIMCVDTNNTN